MNGRSRPTARSSTDRRALWPPRHGGYGPGAWLRVLYASRQGGGIRWTALVALATAASLLVVPAESSGQSGSVSAGSDPPPSAPAAVTAAALSPTEILVAWTAVTDAEGGVKHYNVYRDGERVASTTLLEFTDTGLEPATTYTYRVAAVDSKNREGEKSDPVSATTLDDGDDDDGDDEEGDETPPTAPSNLQAAAAGPRRVDLAWDAASDPESGVASYRVYRDGDLVGSPSGTSFSDTGLEPETTYAYEVSAVNGDGLEGGLSGTVAVTTPAAPDTTPPAAPTRLRIVGG